MAKKAASAGESGGTRLFEFRDGRSDKFWEITLSGLTHTVRYGRVGTEGQSATKEFPSAEKAQASHDKLIAQKVKKGYNEIANKAEARSEQAMTSKSEQKEHEPFLNAISKSPDDFDAYGVYSDWLAERGDPRGEFIQVQWQLDDPDLDTAARKNAKAIEAKLIKQNKDQWLEELAPELTENWKPTELDWVKTPYTYTFARGFLDSLKIEYLLPEFATKLRRSFAATMLRRLEIVQLPHGEELVDEFEQYSDKEWEWDDSPSLDALVSGNFHNLREFVISEGDHGCHISAPSVHKLVKNTPLLEVLVVESHDIDTNSLFKAKLPHLKSLTINHVRDYPISLLAANASLSNLESIVFQPHAFEYDDDEAYLVLDDIRAICRSKSLTNLKHLHLQCTDFGDEGIEEIINSGILQRLETLKLPSGATTDNGANLLIEADLGNLKRLDLSANYLSTAVVKRLKEKNVTLTTSSQNAVSALSEERPHLYDGDME